MADQIVMPDNLRAYLRKEMIGQFIEGMKIRNVLGVGNTAVTFEVDDKDGFAWALKIVTRESYGDRAPFREISRFSTALDERFLVFPKQVGDWSLNYKGREYDFIWFKSRCVKGQTLKKFLDSSVRFHAKSEIMRFVENITVALEELHRLGFRHGDMHDRNIMRESVGEGGRLPEIRYVIIDFSEAYPTDAVGEGLADDLDNFGKHLRSFFDTIHSKMPTSREDEKVLNAIAHIPGLVAGVSSQSAGLPSASAVMDSFIDGLKRAEEAPRKLRDPFHPLNSENIANDALLADLCYTKMSWVPDLQQNDNVLLIGPRGCGKTMIFRRLRLKTKIAANKLKEIEKDPFVGFYLPCESLFYMRFADLSEVDINSNRDSLVLFFNMAILTEICSTLYLVPSSLGTIPSAIIAAITRLLKDEVGTLWQYLNFPSIFTSLNDIAECAESVLRHVRRSIAYRELTEAKGSNDFCTRLVTLLKTHIPFLFQKYCIFFLDDFTEERVPIALQRELHRIVSQRSSQLCFKISAHMFGSIYNQPQPLALDEGRNINVINLGSVYLRLNRKKREGKLLVEILNSRFRHCEGYAGTIEEWLGHTAYPGGRTLARALHDLEVRSKVHYHGIECIRDLCTGDYSEMIRMVGEIFREANIGSGTSVRLIPVHVQDRAIDRVSREYLGRIRHIRPDGQKLFEIVESFGNLSQQKLYARALVGQGKDSKGRPRKDPYDCLSIYVDDLTKASKSARASWERLQKASIFVDIGLAPSQRAVISDRATLRRIYCPAFRTTLTSSEHLQLSKEHFEYFIDKPVEYCKSHLKQVVGNLNQTSMWSEGSKESDEKEGQPASPTIPEMKTFIDLTTTKSEESKILEASLPSLKKIDDVVEFGSTYDLYVGAIGFEERSTRGVESLVQKGVTVDSAVLLEYDLYYDANESQRDVYETSVNSLTRGKPYRPFNAAVGNPDSIFANRLRKFLQGISKGRKPKVLFDCTSCSSLILAKTLSVLLSTQCELTVLYSEAEEYYPTFDEWQSGTLKKGVSRVQGPFAGVRFVAKPPELQSDDTADLPVLLVLFPTFNTERTDGVLADLDPDKRIWIFGEPHDIHRNTYRIEMAKAFAAPIMYPGDEWSIVTTFDYRRTLRTLIGAYEKHRSRYRMVIMPHGSKMQTLAASLFASSYQVSLVFAMPKSYDPNRYSRGCIQTWAIPFGEITGITGRIRMNRTQGGFDVQ